MTGHAQKETGSDAMSTFSPIFDEVSRNLGMSAASVYGVVWRHCQMREGVCCASLRRLAQLLGCNQSTVQRPLRRLITEGYLEDTTPGLRNEPHSCRIEEAHAIATYVANQQSQDDQAPSLRVLHSAMTGVANCTGKCCILHIKETIEETRQSVVDVSDISR